jgi:hypothetical protein
VKSLGAHAGQDLFDGFNRSPCERNVVAHCDIAKQTV